MSRVFPTTRQMRVSHPTSTLSRLPFAALRELPSTSGLKRFSVRGYTAAAALHSTEHASDIEANSTWRPVSDRSLHNLRSIRSLLARDFGGDVQWVERIDSAAANLQEMKAARIAGRCHQRVLSHFQYTEMAPQELGTWYQHCCWTPWPTA